MKGKKPLWKAGEGCHTAVEVQCLEEIGYLAELGEGIETPLWEAGEGCQHALGVQSWEESGYLAELGEGIEALVKAGDGCHPAVGVQCWEDQVTLLNWMKGKKYCEGKWWVPPWYGVQSLEESSYLAELGERKEALVKTGWLPPCSRSAVLVWLPCWAGWRDRSPCKAGDGYHPAVGVQVLRGVW